MALNGSINTNSWVDSDDSQTRYYTLSWTATQSVTDNTSTISWTLKAAGTQTGWVAERTLNVSIAGTTVYSKTARVERVPGTIDSGTITLTHNSDGDKSFAVTINAAVYGSTVNCTASTTFTLTTIPRKSTLSVANGTLGTSQTLTVTRKSTSFTHSIKAVCGSSTLYVKADGSTSTSEAKHSDCDIAFTPPLSWASQNTAGTSVTVTYTITTYSGSTIIGNNSYSKIYSIPTSAKPSCSISVSDATGYASTYGGYIQGVSKLSVNITPTLSYSSPIASYSTTIGGSLASSSASFTTGAIASSGTLSIVSKVTDKRGRSGEATTNISVLAYTKPSISLLKVKRCNSNGTENDQGEYVQVTFSAKVSSLNSKNTSSYTIESKKTSATSYTSIVKDGWANNYSPTNQTYIFAADSGSSHDIRLTAKDKFSSTSWSTVVSTAATIIHFPADGTGMGIGKVVENDGYFEMNYPSQFYKDAHFKEHLTYDIPICDAGFDVNTMLTSGRFYMGVSALNKPGNVNGWLDVQTYGDGNHSYQMYTTYLGARYYRIRNAGQWESWKDVAPSDYLPLSGGTMTGPLTLGNATPGSIYMTNASGTTRNVLHLNPSNSLNLGYGGYSASEGLTNVYGNEVKITSRKTVTVNGFSIATNKVLWSGASHMNASQTATFSEAVDKQAHGIVLIFSFYNSSNSTAGDHDFSAHFVPKYLVSAHSGKGISFTYIPPGYENGYTGTKYLYISNTGINGYSGNTTTSTGTNGIKYNNGQRVLRYVIGV